MNRCEKLGLEIAAEFRAYIDVRGVLEIRIKKSPSAKADGLYKYSGGVLLSHDLSVIVSSALEDLTSVFGMGTGVTPPV